LLRYVTLFPCDTFGFYVSWVYIQYGVQVITRAFPASSDPASAETSGAFVTIILAFLMLVTAFLLRSLSQTDIFHRHVRRFLADYGMPIALIASSGVAYWGRFNHANPTTLPVGGAFQAAEGRAWLVKFWQLEGKWVGIAFPFGLALWVLFFFDHNVSSLMAQGSQYPLRKPPGFHWDFFLLGVTTFVAGLIGVPAPNGLIPQAPIHTESLVIMGPAHKKVDMESKERSAEPSPVELSHRNGVSEGAESGEATRRHSLIVDSEPPIDPTRVPGAQAAFHEVPIAVVEQRVSNLAQGALCMVLLTGPFLHVLHLIPKGVLAGLL
jgi:hypothetical protein